MVPPDGFPPGGEDTHIKLIAAALQFIACATSTHYNT